jgi:hypothetical protein
VQNIRYCAVLKIRYHVVRYLTDESIRDKVVAGGRRDPSTVVAYHMVLNVRYRVVLSKHMSITYNTSLPTAPAVTSILGTEWY